MKKLLLVAVCVLLSGCLPSEVYVQKPNGERLKVLFYSGGSKIDDLLIIDGRNYFGKAEYQINNPTGDVGFKLKTGERVQAECSTVGKNIINEQECKAYVIYRSTFNLLPVGSNFYKPSN